MENKNTETKAKKISFKNSNPSYVAMAICALALFSTTDGFCNSAQSSGLEAASAAYTDLIFSSAIRKTIFGLGFGWGAISSFMKSSFLPFLTYAGLGAVYNFTPSIINLFASL